jgi:plasmid maintenance system antidote protein VapI
MTEIDRILITAGVTFVAAALGAIVAPFLKARFDRDLESRKATLARRAKLHEKEVEIVAELYAITREIADQLDQCARMREIDHEVQALSERRIDDLERYFHRHELFLEPGTRNAFNSVIVDLKRAVIYMSRALRQSLGDAERAEAWTNLRSCACEEIPRSILEAEVVSRPLIRPGE